MAGYICSQICSYRSNSGYCGLTGGYENCQRRLLYQSGSGTVIRKTNADRIRSMTDEELAEWLAKHNERSAVCPNFGAHDCQASCRKCWLDWLKQEATE